MTTPMIRPKSPQEFVALQAARTLGRLDRFAECLRILHANGLPALIDAIRRDRSDDGTLPFPLMPRTVTQDVPPSRRCVLGIKVERRYIAAALVRDLEPDRVQVRALTSQADKAIAAAIRFVAEAAAKFSSARIAVERISSSVDTRRREIANGVLLALAAEQHRVLEVPSETLWQSFSVPACRTQGQLRNTVRRCWPAIAKSRRNAALDASALAMYAYVHSHFDGSLRTT